VAPSVPGTTVPLATSAKTAEFALPATLLIAVWNHSRYVPAVTTVTVLLARVNAPAVSLPAVVNGAVAVAATLGPTEPEKNGPTAVVGEGPVGPVAPRMPWIPCVP